MTAEVLELLRLLTEEKKIYETLLELSKEKRTILTEGHVSELEKLVKIEEGYVRQARDIEEERAKVNDKVARAHGSDGSRFGFSALREVLPGEKAVWFDRFRDEFTLLISEQAALNEINSKLVESMLEYIDISLTAITQNDIIAGNYGQDGKTNQAQSELMGLRLVDMDI